jgi:ribulose-phosphate 3-epimerase
MVEVLPSILSADFAHLADEVAAAERGGAKIIHVDVMDGHFVPNLSLGFPVIQSLRKATKLIFDCHLMIEHPDDFIPAFAEAGANWVSVHVEACRHLHRTLEHIREHGMEPAVVINPATPVNFLDEVLPMVHHVLVMSVNPGYGGQKFIPFALDKISLLKKIREERELSYLIEVDGGVDHETVESVVKAGADLLVAGSAVFGKGDGETATRELILAALTAAGQVREAKKLETVGKAG